MCIVYSLYRFFHFDDDKKEEGYALSPVLENLGRFAVFVRHFFPKTATFFLSIRCPSRAKNLSVHILSGF